MARAHRRDRKKQLLIYGVASAVVATATIGTIAVASPGFLESSADAKAAAPGAVLQAQFEDAAREFDVPQSVLMAVSYRQTRWESHDGLPSTSGAYNVMGLTQVTPEDLEEHSDEEHLAHLNRSGDPVVEKKFNRALALKAVRDHVDTTDPRLHTLDEAAKLIDKSADTVQSSPEQSIRAGAALLAEYQRDATGSLSDDPGKWYPGVARFSQSPDAKGADLFAKRVFESIKTGERALTTDGELLSLPADSSVTPVKPSKLPLAASFASTSAVPTPECPAGLNCNFVAAGYAKDQGNYNIASRPANGFDIRQIIIHDTEGGYAGSLAHFQNPAVFASAHYLIRASDGLVTQMVETKNEAWHAANKTANMHSVGIEHEGFAIKEGSWYTEPQYESSAAIVKYVAAKYSIPLDREHIIGHDEVPGVLDDKVKSQHWDPGPFWDWNHYMSLIGAPTGAGGAGAPVKAGQLVRIVPPFTTANQPKLTNGGTAVATQPANFGYLYTSPVVDPAATVQDVYMGSVTYSDGANWENKVLAGGEYVVAEARTNWTAIWYGGQKAWFYNPGGQFTAPVGKTSQTVLAAKAGATSIPVYGRAYPEDAAYEGTGVPVQTNNTASLTKYSLPAGQRYTPAGAAVNGDYYYSAFGTDGTLVKGTNSFYPIRFNHRLAYVRASDVQELSSTAPDLGATRYNTLARDTSGVLWQYQGTGSATAPYLTRYRLGSGWNAYNAVTSMTALRADAVGDTVARDTSGVLWYYRASGNPSAPFLTRLQVGKGWQIYNQLTGARDVTGDGKADLIGRDAAGVLWLYAGTGTPATPFGARVQVGKGWQIYNQLTDTGDVTGDGKADLLARDTSGAMWLYNGTGSATTPYAARTAVGKGWQIYNTLGGPSDLSGDGKPDVLARDASGVMWLYKGRGSATTPFEARVQIATGWQIYNLLV